MANQPPSSERTHTFHTFSHTRDRAISVMKSMSPQVTVLAFDCLFRGNRPEFETILSLVELMRRNGFDPDPSNVIRVMYDRFLPVIETMPGDMLTPQEIAETERGDVDGT